MINPSIHGKTLQIEMTNEKSSRTRKPTTPTSRAQLDEAQVPGQSVVDAGDNIQVKDMLTGSSVEPGIVSQNPTSDSTYPIDIRELVSRCLTIVYCI